jgi:hypothetical protein
MPAHEANPPVPSPGDDGEDRDDDRTAGGAVGFLRQHARTLIVVLVVAIVGYAALAGPGGGGSSDDDAAPAASTTAPADQADPETTAPAGTTAPGATEVTDPAPTSTLVPQDVDTDRPPIDLTKPPAATDPVELARWWAGTYTMYIGAEPPVDLVARLSDWTAPGLLDQLGALPPAASYDAPLEIEGVSEVDLPAGTGAPAGSRQVRVSVQASAALVIYDMTLVPGGGGGGWLVSEAARL